MSEKGGIGFFEKYLSVWVIICIAVGIAIGELWPAFPNTLGKWEYAHVSIPIAILIWMMVFPMMLKVDFKKVKSVAKQPKGIVVTCVTNWIIKPFSMFGISWFFFFVVFKYLIPLNLADEYLAGAVLLGAAPCTAMVFVWSYLTKGDAAYTLVQVAVNDLILLIAFVPIVGFLLGIGGIAIPWDTLILSVVLFMVIPLIAGIIVRIWVIKRKGEEYFKSAFVNKFGPVTTIGLLLTLIILFSFQGKTILSNPLHIVLIAIPLIIQTFVIFFIAFGWARAWKLPQSVAAPAALIGASNFFELAVAVAISLFGLNSGAALATVVGVLVEVPVMLTLVRIANSIFTKPAMKRVPLLIFAFSILTSLIFTNLNSWAVPAKPGFVNALQPDGSTIKIRLEGDGSFLKAFTEEGVELTTDEEGFYIPVSKTNHQPQEIEANKRIKQRGPGLMQTTFPSKGEQKALVILVEFTNLTFSMDNPHEYYTRMLNEPGYSQDGGTGSARDYFRINSHGQFNPVFDVVGPVTVSDTYQYYGKNNGWGDDDKAPDMIVEACRLVDDEIDFAEYDRDNDGIIDNVFVFYAGYGEADGGGANTIWPHSANMIDVRENLHYYFDDKRLNHYACSNEIQHTTRMIDGIGTFCHEFGHVLGLPDLYSTIFYAFTPGYWDIMSTGSYNNDGRTPPYYSSYERYALDWLTPHELPEGFTTLGDLEKTNKAIIIHTEKDNEYFLLENRQNNGFDKYLPGHGMLVWHIDYNSNVWNNNIVNAFDMHQYVDLLEADNIQDFNTIDGDSFPGAANITEISGKTRPGLVSWSGEASAVRIFDISENDGMISFYVEGGEGEDFDDEVTFDEFLNEESSGVSPAIEETEFIKINGNRIETLLPDTFIYDISGKLVTKLSYGSTELQPGIYIAIRNGQVFKFFVRRL